MTIAGIKFVWGRKNIFNTRWRLGLFEAYHQGVSPVTGETYAITDGSKNVYPLVILLNVKGLLAWLGVLTFSAYLAGAAVILQIYEKRPHNLVSYYDLVWPMRWSQLRDLRGQANLADAKDQIDQGQYGPAFMNLRVGLARHPENTDARLTLAVIYIAIHQRSQADRLLMDVFDYGYPGLDFVQKAINLLKDGDNIDGVLRYCDLAQASLAKEASPRLWDARYIHQVHIETLMNLGRYDEALALSEKFTKRPPYVIAEIKARQALARNDPAAAEPELKEWLALVPQSRTATTALIRARRMAGRLADMQAAVSRLRELSPMNPGYVTTGLKEYWLAGANDQAAALLDEGVLRFSSQPKPLFAWATAAAEADQNATLDRIEAIMAEHNFDIQGLLASKLFSEIKRGQWEQARATGNRLEAMGDQLEKGVAMSETTAKALITICTQPENAGDGENLILVDALGRQKAPIFLYKLVIESLLAKNRLDSALNVIAAAKGEFPASTYVDTKDAEARSLKFRQDQTTAAALAATVKTETKPVFSGATELLSSLDKQADDGKPEDALNAIRAVRKSPPPWFGPTTDEKLAWREILFSAQATNLPLLQLNLRTYLRNQPARAAQVLSQAKTWFGQDHKSLAILAAREILRTQSNYQPALEAMAVWDPPPEATAKGPVPAASDAE